MKTSAIISQFNAGLLSKTEAETKLKEVCPHEDIEYEFMYDGEPWPMFLGGHCLECEQDFPASSFSEKERYAIEQTESEDMISREIDAAMDYQRDLNAGLL